MSSLQDLVEVRVGLPPGAVDHLQALVSDWQVLADLSFADLLLFCRDDSEEDSPKLVVVAQMRPYTAQTLYHEDMVGRTFADTERPAVVTAIEERRIVREGDPDWSSGVPV
ncbi:MAG: histidine kinase N-terminal domain-containing protein, partial [Actinobacteria bacterium]|nr:histidine kinase N-terminal domain-containing protein [Actinomycetota bacterium]